MRSAFSVEFIQNLSRQICLECDAGQCAARVIGIVRVIRIIWILRIARLNRVIRITWILRVARCVIASGIVRGSTRNIRIVSVLFDNRFFAIDSAESSVSIRASFLITDDDAVLVQHRIDVTRDPAIVFGYIVALGRIR